MSDDLLVLRDHMTPDHVLAVAAAAGWELRSDTVRSHFVAASLGWRAGPGTVVDYFEDHTADVRFIRAQGPAAGAAAAQLRAALEHFEPEELFLALEESDDPLICIRGLGRLAVLRTSDTQARCLQLWLRGLSHTHPAVRRAAIRTSYGKPWPELAPTVRKQVDNDPALAGPLRQLSRYLDRAADEAHS